jgi:hypothetical protein
MPLQVAPYIVGTINGMCYYQMNGIYYMRKCPNVKKRKRKEADSYERQRLWSGNFGDCSKLSSKFYCLLPFNKRKAQLQQEGTGLAVRMTREGKSITEIEQALMELMGLKHIEKPQEVKCVQFIEGKLTNIQGKTYMHKATPNGEGGWDYHKGRIGNTYRKRLVDEAELEKTMRGEVNAYADISSEEETPPWLKEKEPLINKLYESMTPVNTEPMKMVGHLSNKSKQHIQLISG